MVYSEDQLQTMRKELAQIDLESLDDTSLFDIFLEGCIGYNKTPDIDIIELFEYHYEDYVWEESEKVDSSE